MSKTDKRWIERDHTKSDAVDASAIEVDSITQGAASGSNDVQEALEKLSAADLASGSHTHDDRYYTETEVDNLLTGKEDTFAKNTAFNKDFGTGQDDVASGNHIHDDRYYTENEIDTLIDSLSGAFGECLCDYVKRDGSTYMSGDLDMSGYLIHNLGTPTLSGDAVNKQYVDAQLTGISSDEVKFDVTMSGHSFSTLNALYHDGSNWALAQADDPETLATHVIVDTDTDIITLGQIGRFEIPSHGLTPGEYYHLSDTTAGLLTEDAEQAYSNPLAYVEDSSHVHLLAFRPSNAATEGTGGSSPSTGGVSEKTIYTPLPWVGTVAYFEAPNEITYSKVRLSALTAPSGGSAVCVIEQSARSGSPSWTTVATLTLGSGSYYTSTTTVATISADRWVRVRYTSTNSVADAIVTLEP